MQAGDTVANRFVLEAQVGSGGMGVVFRARDLVDFSTVAVKIPWLDTQEERLAIEHEASILLRVSHPSIVRHVAHGVDDFGRAYLAMGWIYGESLRRRQGRKPLSLARILHVVRDLAHALGAVHDAGLVHADLKPANVLLSRSLDGRVVLIDFGVSTEISQPREPSRRVVGTPSFMSPEQAHATASLDPRSDVFSLGCLLFWCLVGRAPFAAKDGRVILARLLLDEPPSLSELRPDLPRWLHSLTARLLSHDPALRPAHGAEVARELSDLLQEHQVSIHEEQATSIRMLVAPKARPSGSEPAPSSQPVSSLRGSSAAIGVVLARATSPEPQPPSPELLERIRQRAGTLAMQLDLAADGSIVALLRPLHAGPGGRFSIMPPSMISLLNPEQKTSLSLRELASAARAVASSIKDELPHWRVVVLLDAPAYEERLDIGELLSRGFSLLEQGNSSEMLLEPTVQALLKETP